MGENVLLSASHDKTVRMWSVAKGSCLAVIDHPAPVMCCTLEVRRVPTCLFVYVSASYVSCIYSSLSLLALLCLHVVCRR